MGNYHSSRYSEREYHSSAQVVTISSKGVTPVVNMQTDMTVTNMKRGQFDSIVEMENREMNDKLQIAQSGLCSLQYAPAKPVQQFGQARKIV